MIKHAAIAAAVACAVGSWAADAGASTGIRTVSYRGYAFEVPASWPVHRLAADPSTCVRFDRHAVYLGHPGSEQSCPAHVVGRSGVVLVEPLPRATLQTGSARALRAPSGRAAPAKLPASRSASELHLDVPSAGVRVTATWRRSPARVRRILDGARLTPAAKPSQAPVRSESAPSPQATAGAAGYRSAAGYRKGLGFDACAAPSKSAMSAWSSSPYQVAGVYIGGANRGCSQPNLTAGWVRNQIDDGWGLIPIYVGLQAPANVCGCAAIKRSKAKSQGRAAARDAISDAQGLGLVTGSPIYFDLEGYSRTSTNSKAVLRFLSGWTARLHSGDYTAGVYSSAGSGIVDLAGRYGTSYREPDDIWIANWDGKRTTHDAYVPDRYWSDHQRIRQYRGAHNESYGGHTINIDNDYVDGAVAGASDRDADGVPDDLDLCPTVEGLLSNSGCPYPSHVTGGLVRYRDSVDGDRRQGDHFTTTGAVDPAYRFQGNLGYLYNTHLAGTQGLFSCTSDRDQFVSRAADCGGAKVLGLIGYAYSKRPRGIPTQAIYSCSNGTTGERTVSYDRACNRPKNTNLGRLGFTISVASLGRYLDSVDGDRRQGDHFTTTGAVDPAYRFQGNLGYLYNTHLAGTQGLFSCTSDRDQFVSRAADCGGAKVLGLIGYAYSKRPRGIPTQAIYSCSNGTTGERTVSYDRACNRPKNTNLGRLGFTISVASLGRYLDSVDGDRRQGDHFTTTGAVDPAYRFQGNLGYLYNTHLAGTQGLFSCTSDRDQFVSRAADCGGAKVLGLIGYAYSKPARRVPTRPLYACRSKDRERFVSAKSSCRRPTDRNQGLLGYAMSRPFPG